MAEYIQMPKLGFDMREGVLVGWLKQTGDVIEKGDIVAEIESDKATLELEAQATGTLLQLLAREGDVVPIGGNMAIVGEPNEDISGLAELAEAEDKPAATDSSPSGETAPVVEGHHAMPLSTSDSAEFPSGIKATPVARRLAAARGIDLRRIAGTGPGGRIRKGDVENFVEQPPMATTVAPPAAPVAVGPESEAVPMSRLRQAIGRRMVESKSTVPHFYVTSEVDMEAALALRKEINALISPEHKVTVNDMIVKAAALTLREFPNINATFGGDKIIRHNRINVGSAVAVEGGLLTIVQKNTDLSPLAQIAADNKQMVARARAGKSRPSDFDGGTFTVSNLGGFDVAHFVAIINPPDAAILAVGSARQVPVVVDGELTVGWRMQATISADHRVTDGAEVAQYMQSFKKIMEEPLRLLV